MIALTRMQARILGIIRDSVSRRGYPPTVREIGAAAKSPSSVAYQLGQLHAAGWIQRDPNSPRAMRILDPAEGAA